MDRVLYLRAVRWGLAVGLAGGLMLSCAARIDQGSSGSGGAGAVDSGGGGQPGSGGAKDAAGPVDGGGAQVDTAVCLNLCLRQTTCPGGGTTSISGTIHAPTPARFGAADPLYNVLVYVPNAPVTAFSPGVSCQRCEGASGSPLVSVLTGPDGKFVLKNAPVGANVPLVIQIGRWRRQITVPNVAACTDTALPDELTRLPRNQKEGDIPAMAIATGIWDPFDCTLRKIGIDEAEFTQPTGPGRVHVFAYGGHRLNGMTPNGDTLVGSVPELSKYDLVLLPCDDNSTKEKPLLDNVRAYSDKGGRVFLTDWSYSWLQDGGTFEGTVQWKPEPVGVGDDFTGVVDTGFPKGAAFSSWLTVVGAARPTAGRLPIHDPYGGSSLVDAVVPPTQRWLYTDDPEEKALQHLTFNTPVGAAEDKQCGRVVFSQFHVADGDGFLPIGGTFPASCDNKPMTPQEKALEFMLFDLSSCVQPDREVPIIP